MKLTMMHGSYEDRKVKCTILSLNLVVASFLSYLMVKGQRFLACHTASLASAVSYRFRAGGLSISILLAYSLRRCYCWLSVGVL